MATAEQIQARIDKLEAARDSGAASITDADGKSMTLRPGPELDRLIARLKRQLGKARRPGFVLGQVRRDGAPRGGGRC